LNTKTYVREALKICKWWKKEIVLGNCTSCFVVQWIVFGCFCIIYEILLFGVALLPEIPWHWTSFQCKSNGFPCDRYWLLLFSIQTPAARAFNWMISSTNLQLLAGFRATYGKQPYVPAWMFITMFVSNIFQLWSFNWDSGVSNAFVMWLFVCCTQCYFCWWLSTHNKFRRIFWCSSLSILLMLLDYLPKLFHVIVSAAS
jgi:hypothetical protein